MTNAEYLEWLKDNSAKRTALVEVDLDSTLHLSVLPFTTLPSDPKPNVRYDAVIKGGVGYDETLELSGGSRSSYATISLNNEDGSLDPYVQKVWHNRSIRVYYGDVRWDRSDYRLVVEGVVESCKVNRNSVSILLKDKLKRLDSAVTEDLLGGDGVDSEALNPLLFGECHNINPRLYHAGDHEYVFHKGTIESIIEVRDRGVPVSFTTTTRGFKLNASPDGEITLSAQGYKDGTYQNRVAKLIEILVTKFGPSTSRFTTADLDTANLNAFNTAHPQPVGVYLRDRATVQQTVEELARAVKAQPSMSRLGKLRLLKIQVPPTGTPTEILLRDYEEGSLEIVNQSDVIAGVRLGYCRQWTPQQIAEGVPSEHREMFAEEWLTVTKKDQTVANEYRIETETEQENVLLLRKVDANSEATRQLALWSVPRTVYRVRGFAHLLELELGQAVKLQGKRFGLESGVIGQVVGLKPDWVAGRCDVEVLI